MAFRFSLAALLRFRESLEHQQEVVLLEANQNVARVHRAIEDVDRTLVEAAVHNENELQSGMSAAELQFILLGNAALRTCRKELERELVQAEELRATRRHEYQQARSQRLAVQTLRDRQSQLYNEQATRQEQRGLDDLFLLRREFLRRS